VRNNRINTWLYRHKGARAALLLALPVLWLAIAYLGSLAVMLISSLWSVDSFTGNTVHSLSFGNFHTLITQRVYSTIAIRSIGVAIAVTLIDGLLAIPIALLSQRFSNHAFGVW